MDNVQLVIVLILAKGIHIPVLLEGQETLASGKIHILYL